jgi:hypothetical protein
MLRRLRGFAVNAATFVAVISSSGCYFFDFFNSSTKSGSGGAVDGGTVLGRSLGNHAGGVDEAALASVYAATSSHAPAAIRPDPDLYARRMLLQYREEGSTVARQIGAIESYRTLLGGASEDFIKKPQEEYDATSLLATYKVAESVCTGLVNPNASEHPGWESILPAEPTEIDTNLKFLAQRFLGRPAAKIEPEIIDSLRSILEGSNTSGALTNATYVPVCAMLALDAEALFL